ncbi:MAG: T9SS type A sorting domain-containing protein [Bacteroidia bacterium]|nr:T9SS type A sorting domain-containing protein [Bacteroidia bacterium]
MPKTPGIYIASLKDSFDVNGMITGATINSDSTICLIGYDDTDPFIWLLFNYTGSNLLSGNKRRIDLLGMGEFQTEAIGFVDGSKYYISNENNFASTANVYEFYTVQWITGIENDNRITANDRLQYSVYPNPTTSMINIDFHGNFDRVIVKLMDAMGRLMFTSTLNNLSSHQMDLNISHLEQGIYFLEITVDQVQHSVKKIIIN